MIGMRKVISTIRLKMKKILPIILTEACWAQSSKKTRSQECDQVKRVRAKIPAQAEEAGRQVCFVRQKYRSKAVLLILSQGYTRIAWRAKTM
jgi:hypothetical protein